MNTVIGIIAVAVVGWFAVGTIWNIGRGRAVMRWMQDGLPVFGARTTVRWLGSTAAELIIRDGLAPFDAATVVIFLEPRDMPWLWALTRGRGRRDTLIVRGELRRAPDIEFEALNPATWSGREARRALPPEWPVREVAARGGVVVHPANRTAGERAEVLLARAERAGLVVQRLSLRCRGPHFELHVRLPDRRQPARDFFEAVRALAQPQSA
jgi:hypothetical protein